MSKTTQEHNDLLGKIEDIAFVLQNINKSILDSVTENDILEQEDSPCLVGAVYENALQTRIANIAIQKLANAITPFTAVPGTDATGGGVASLTEAVMGVTSGLCQIAEAINRLAETVEDFP